MRNCPRLRRRAVFLLLFLPVAWTADAIAQQPVEAPAQPLTLPLGRRHVVNSKITGATYHVTVMLPMGYDTLTRGADAPRYPTFYALDGAWMLFTAYFRSGYPISPDVIVVGINSPTPAEHRQRRTLDLTPPDDSSAWAKRSRQGGLRFGGADAFLRALKEEIIPVIDRTYRTNGDRGIHGHSYGGLFVAYAMLEAPELFTRYAMTSPSLWWADQGLIAREPAFAKQHPEFPKRVFMSIGSDEGSIMAAAMYQFAARLCWSFGEGYYKGLELTVESIAGEDHGGTVHQLRAVRALYPGDTTGLPRSIPRVPKPRGELWQCR